MTRTGITPSAVPIRVIRRLLFFGLLFLGVAFVLALSNQAAASPLAGASANMDRVCTLAGATIADKTSAANDNTANDVTVGDELLNTGVDEVYYGMNAVFSTLTINVGTAGTVGASTWYYHTASGWTSLVATDLTVGYLTTGTNTVTWTIPSDWTTYEVSAANCSGARYYVKSTTTVNYVTLPKATQVSATPFNVALKVQDELGTAQTGLASSAFSVASGTTNTLFAFREIGSGVYQLALDTAGADVNFDVTAAKDGYVTSSALATGSLTTSQTDKTGTPIALSFAFKVTGVSNELSSSLTTVTVSTGTLFTTSCTESGGAWFCAVPLADTAIAVRAAKDGYVTNEATSFASDRTAAGDAQRTVAVTGVQFAVKVTSVANELSGALSSVTVTTGDAFGTSCTESGGAWYCAVPLANTGTDVKAAKDGYVTKTSLVAFVDRLLASDAQRTATVTGVPFALKVTGVADELSNALTSVTVAAGDSFGVSCTESAGAWYCAIPLAHTSTDVRGAKDGYVTKTASAAFTDRTAATDAQSTASVTGVQFAYKVTSVTSEISSSLTGVTVKTGNAFGTTCTESGGAWYCAVPLADTGVSIEAAKDGYVTGSFSSFASDRTAASEAQVAGTVTGLAYAYKVTGVTSEAGASLTSVTVSTGDSFGVACSESSGAWYCAVPVAHTGIAVRVAKAGYVTNEATSFASDRTSNADAHRTVAVASVQYAVKVTGVADELSNALSGVTVLAGDGLAISCTESAGAWYCAVPEGDLGTDVRVAKDGYVTKTALLAYAPRLLATTAQSTATVTGVQFALKVTGVQDEVSNALTSATLTAGDAFAVSCTESGGAWYCAIPLAHTSTDVKAAKDGYVTKTASSAFTDRTAATDAQRTATVTSVQFAYQVSSLASEAGTALTGATITTGDALSISCTESSGAWYCPVPLADTDLTIQVAKDGYVTDNSNAFAADRTSASDAQVSVAADDIQFTVKVIVSSESDLSGVSWEKKVGAGAYEAATPTATVGNVAYFAQTAGESDLVFRATKDGSTDDTGAPFDPSAASQAAFSLDIVGLLTATSAAAASLVAGALTTYTFGFTLAHPWPANGLLTVTFPASYALGSPDVTLTGADGTATAAVLGQVVTITRAADGSDTAAGTDVTVELTDVTNPHVAGTSGSFGLVAQDDAALDIDVGTASALTIAVGALNDLSTSADDLVVGAQTTYTFGFTNANPWPADGQLTIELPAAYTIGAPTVTLTGADGTATASVDGQTVTLTRSGDGSETAAETAITVELTDVTNPDLSGTTDTFALVLGTGDATEIDAGEAPAVTLAAGSLTGLSTSALSLAAAATTTYTFGFTLAHDWPADGLLVITFPDGYTIDDPLVVLTGATGAATASVDGQTVTITRSALGLPTDAGTAVTVELTGVTNPSDEGATDAFALLVEDADETAIDTGDAPAVTIGASSLALAGLASSSHTVDTWTRSTRLSVSWATPSDVTVNGYSWAIDADPDTTVDGTVTHTTITLTQGEHDFRVKARNAGAIWGPVATIGLFRVDTSAPTAPSISSGTHEANACTSAADASLAWDASDDLSGLDGDEPYGYTVDGASQTRTSDASLALTLADGSHTLKVWAYDAVGNSASATYRFSVDLRAPSVRLTVPAVTNAATLPLKWSSSDACAGAASVFLEYRANAGSWTDVSSTGASGTSNLIVPDGKIEFRARGVDAAGNAGDFPATAQATSIVDRVAPGAPANVHGTMGAANTFHLAWAAAKDDRSGIGAYRVTRVTESGATLATALVHGFEYVDAAGRTDVHYTVQALDLAGNAGPVVQAAIDLTASPAAGAQAFGLIVPRESGSAVPIAWHGPAGADGTVRVDIWIGEAGHDLRLYLSSSQAQGRASFFGLVGHDYRVVAVPTDAAGHAPTLDDAPEATVRITDASVRASRDAALLAGNLATDEPFRVEDRDGDGFPETLIDPSGRLTVLHIVSLDDARPFFLLGVGARLSGGNPTAFWDPASGEAIPIALTLPLGRAQGLADGALRVQVEKHAGWIYVPVSDAHPDRPLEAVYRADGSPLPEGHYWRDGNVIVFLDDPTTEYIVTYGSAATQTMMAGANLVWLSVAPLLAFLAFLFIPSTATLPRLGLTWSLRHCTTCGQGLTRIERVWRAGHCCPNLGDRLAGHRRGRRPADTAPRPLVPKFPSRPMSHRLKRAMGPSRKP